MTYVDCSGIPNIANTSCILLRDHFEKNDCKNCLVNQTCEIKGNSFNNFAPKNNTTCFHICILECTTIKNHDTLKKKNDCIMPKEGHMEICICELPLSLNNEHSKENCVCYPEDIESSFIYKEKEENKSFNYKCNNLYRKKCSTIISKNDGSMENINCSIVNKAFPFEKELFNCSTISSESILIPYRLKYQTQLNHRSIPESEAPEKVTKDNKTIQKKNKQKINIRKKNGAIKKKNISTDLRGQNHSIPDPTKHIFSLDVNRDIKLEKDTGSDKFTNLTEFQYHKELYDHYNTSENLNISYNLSIAFVVLLFVGFVINMALRKKHSVNSKRSRSVGSLFNMNLDGKTKNMEDRIPLVDEMNSHDEEEDEDDQAQEDIYNDGMDTNQKTEKETVAVPTET